MAKNQFLYQEKKFQTAKNAILSKNFDLFDFTSFFPVLFKIFWPSVYLAAAGTNNITSSTLLVTHLRWLACLNKLCQQKYLGFTKLPISWKQHSWHFKSLIFDSSFNSDWVIWIKLHCREWSNKTDFITWYTLQRMS